MKPKFSGCSCRTAARFLNVWPTSGGEGASGTEAKATSTKPSGSTRATFYLLAHHAHSYICLRRFPEALRKFAPGKGSSALVQLDQCAVPKPAKYFLKAPISIANTPSMFLRVMGRHQLTSYIEMVSSSTLAVASK